MTSCTCQLLAIPRLEIRCQTITKTHKPYEWALEGTLENLKIVDEFLKSENLRGYLFGGCLRKRLPRKDIDVMLYPSSKNPAYKTLGVDWWYSENTSGPDPIITNVNNITTKLEEYNYNYGDKQDKGLLLPNKFIREHPRSRLVKLLYKFSDLHQLKGGEERNESRTRNRMG